MTTDAERKSGDFLRKRMFEKLASGKGFDSSKGIPAPSQEVAQNDSEFCIYHKMLTNPESTTMKSEGKEMVKEYCSRCSGYSPACSFYSTAP